MNVTFTTISVKITRTNATVPFTQKSHVNEATELQENRNRNRNLVEV